MSTDNPHEKHRERMRARFRESGFSLDAFAPHEQLEFLLFHVFRREDTNALAHRLIDSFGNISAVFDAKYEDLLKIHDIGEQSATLIKLIPALTRSYLTSRSTIGKIVNTVAEAGDYLMPRFSGKTYESVVLMCLDAKNEVKGVETVGSGDINSAQINIRGIVSAALKHNATSCILAHNHTSGIACPSEEDVAATLTVIDALDTIGVTLFDHLVMVDDDFVSFRESSML